MKELVFWIRTKGEPIRLASYEEDSIMFELFELFEFSQGTNEKILLCESAFTPLRDRLEYKKIVAAEIFKKVKKEREGLFHRDFKDIQEKMGALYDVAERERKANLLIQEVDGAAGVINFLFSCIKDRTLEEKILFFEISES